MNLLLAEVDPDFATLRRYLVDERLLARENGRYRVIEANARDRIVHPNKDS